MRVRLALLLTLIVLLAACGPGQKPRRPAAKKKGPPEPQVWMELRRGREPRELAHIGVRGVSIGPEGGRMELKLFAETGRSDEAWYLLRSYAPFEAKTPQGDLLFHGNGRTLAGPAEKRMVLEWARRVTAEAAGGRVGDAYGLLLAWHQGGSSGICQDVALYLTGEAVATACGWDGGVHGRLDPSQLGRIYDWFDRLKPFQAGAGDQESGQAALEARLVFAGRGPRDATPAEQSEIRAFATSLWTELAARKEGPAPASTPQPTPTPAPTPSATPPPPPSRLLLPPRLVPPREAEIPLQLPETPPPPPKPEPTPNAPGIDPVRQQNHVP